MLLPFTDTSKECNENVTNQIVDTVERSAKNPEFNPRLPGVTSTNTPSQPTDNRKKMPTSTSQNCVFTQTPQEQVRPTSRYLFIRRFPRPLAVLALAAGGMFAFASGARSVLPPPPTNPLPDQSI